MGDNSIVLKSVNKYYGNYHALRDINLTVAAQEKLVICGPSGSGKSTLIRCINQLEQHETGDIIVDGMTLTGGRHQLEMVRRNVGMVFQHFNLFPHLTILENCILPQIRTLNKSKSASVDEARAQLDRMHVYEHAQKYPDELSGGQQQRVALARALCIKPKIMLFDEPTSALDPEMISEVLDTMIDLAKGSMTLICVTHEMGFARQVADQVVFMANGQIIETGTVAEVFNNPRQGTTKAFMKTVRQKERT